MLKARYFFGFVVLKFVFAGRKHEKGVKVLSLFYVCLLNMAAATSIQYTYFVSHQIVLLGTNTK